jgi:hypothetical protein
MAAGAADQSVAIAVRTLLAAGFTITGSRTYPRYVEVTCVRRDVLGTTVPYLLALTNEAEFSPAEIEDVKYSAKARDMLPAFVASAPQEGQMSWNEFYDALGGEVPSWKALSKNYGELLTTASNNELPPGFGGEAWLLFETLVADGLEFALGRRVRRLGGKARGRTVSDLVAQLPDYSLLVVDAKATGNEFDVNKPNLRPLGEYVRKQVIRQAGQNEVLSALVVSSRFAQDGGELMEQCLDFQAEYGLPVCFLRAEALRTVVQSLSDVSSLRNALRWRHIFRGGLVDPDIVQKEIKNTRSERY